MVHIIGVVWVICLLYIVSFMCILVLFRRSLILNNFLYVCMSVVTHGGFCLLGSACWAF